ncbi:MAG: 2-succinyl-5-enolpyruvyl-6-hydroxy-3-cyclohexene-carboxylate synthase [Solirubrobacteraceae bacterium]|nr:2-succinyl-5-enolpyruvyl-6-hydroxy-3-cyclohexene-carboxylate synthase [Solirubrobacteraceae bacterium]
MDSHVLLRAFCDELARCGMTDACTSPGSRSSPIVLALARERRLRAWSHVDERCAGFFALGAAKASGRPVAVAVTSGTATAELTPAVHEAREARVPLLVLTADRPPELREVGAGQVIDQVKLYGSAAKWFFEVGTHEATPERVRWMRALACRAYRVALEARAGVVHLNFALREPLLPPAQLPPDETGRPGGAPWTAHAETDARPEPDALDRLARLVAERPRGVIVAGRWERGAALGTAAAGLSEATGYPVLADPLSGARLGGAVAHYDALLRDDAWAGAHAPDLVLRVGDLPTSKPLRAWLAGAPDAEQVAIVPDGVVQDPDAAVTRVVHADPAVTLAELAEHTSRAPDAAWVAAWERADAAAVVAIGEALGGELSEPLVAAELGRLLPREATLFVASSMPVRDVETFFPARTDAPRVLSNRGANGIDGTVSSAFGVAAASGGPVVLLTGDVALAYDIGGLLAARRLGLDVKVVLLNNDGGGIFHFLPIAGERDAFEEHVATPTGLDFARAAELYGLEHRRVDSREALAERLAAPGPAILEVRTDREANVALHRAVWERVSAAAR